MNKNLLILGAGQYGSVIKGIAESMDCFEKIDFLDDTFVSAGAVVNHNSFVADYCHIDNNSVVMSGAFLEAMKYVEPLEKVRRVPLKFTISKNGQIKKEDISKRTPVGDGYNFDEVM